MNANTAPSSANSIAPQSVTPWIEIGLIAERDIRRTFVGPKAIILLAISILGAGMTTFFVHYMTVKTGISKTGAPDLAQVALLALLPKLLSISIWLSPLIVALLGFDALSGQLQYRSIRYWSVRTRRVSFYIGHVLSLWACTAIFLTVTNLAIFLILTVRDPDLITHVYRGGLREWFAAYPILLAWSAIAVLVSSATRTPVLALFLTLMLFFVIWCVHAIGEWRAALNAAEPLLEAEQFHWTSLAYPNVYERFLVATEPKQLILGLLGCFGIVGAVTTLGTYLFVKRDV